MTLSCWCPDEAPTWQYELPDGYTPFPTLMRRKRCSCGKLINPGELAARFFRTRQPQTEIEYKIYGEYGEVEISALWLCERCADIFFSLHELGYDCVAPDEKMLDLLEEYKDDH
jgi:hypothetical protein